MHKYHVQQRIKAYEENKKRIDSGKHSYVPFYGFDKLQKYVPGIMPGIMYKITSHMGVGKTQIAKYLFVYQTILYAIQHNINFQVIYFALEESKDEFLDGLFIHLIKRLHKKQLDRFKMGGASLKSLDKSEMDLIKKTEYVLSNIVDRIQVIDDKYTPSAMFDVCRTFAKRWGTLDADDNYIPNDPEQIVLVVTDHISLLAPEYEKTVDKFLDERKTIAKWHTLIGKRVITKKWKWAMLNIQQQSLESEKQQFTSRGDSIINKILPSLDGLGNNKEVARDDYVVLGLFAPERYNIEEFRGYDIIKKTPESFGDRFRSLHLLKNRFGHPNKVLPLYFDGRYTYFKEMPIPTDPKISYFHNLLKT